MNSVGQTAGSELLGSLREMRTARAASSVGQHGARGSVSADQDASAAEQSTRQAGRKQKQRGEQGAEEDGRTAAEEGCRACEDRAEWSDAAKLRVTEALAARNDPSGQDEAELAETEGKQSLGNLTALSESATGSMAGRLGNEASGMQKELEKEPDEDAEQSNEEKEKQAQRVRMEEAGAFLSGVYEKTRVTPSEKESATDSANRSGEDPENAGEQDPQTVLEERTGQAEDSATTPAGSAQMENADAMDALAPEAAGVAKASVSMTADQQSVKLQTVAASVSLEASITTSLETVNLREVTNPAAAATVTDARAVSGAESENSQIRKGIDMFLEYLHAQLQNSAAADSSAQSAQSASGTILNSQLHLQTVTAQDLLDSMDVSALLPGSTGAAGSSSSLSLSAGMSLQFTTSSSAAQRYGIGTSSHNAGSSSGVGQLSPDQYKLSLLLAVLANDPDARERAMKSIRSAAQLQQMFTSASAQDTGLSLPAATGTQAAQSTQTTLSVSFNLNAAALSAMENYREGGLQQKTAAMMQLSASVTVTMQADPLVLDLAGDGVHLSGAANGVQFDLDGDGENERTGFVRGDDALLYLDANGNGVADNGRELFGDQEGDANGFAELSRYDDNGDGQIDASDAVYGQLRLWQDGNGDGVCQRSETHTLQELQVQSIGLSNQLWNQDDGNGNTLAQAGSFTRSDGTSGLAVDALLAYQR